VGIADNSERSVFRSLLGWLGWGEPLGVLTEHVQICVEFAAPFNLVDNSTPDSGHPPIINRRSFKETGCNCLLLFW
jgi:hypothetical protein